MRQIPKTELSPENGCVIDTKWKLGPLSYHSCATEIGDEPLVDDAPMPEIVVSITWVFAAPTPGQT